MIDDLTREEIEKEIATCRNRLRRDPADFQAQWIPELEKLVIALEFGDDDAIYEAVCNAEARQIRLTTYAAMELAEDEWFFRSELERVGFEPPNRNGTVAYMAQQALDFSVHLESMEDHGYAVSSDNNIAEAFVMTRRLSKEWPSTTVTVDLITHEVNIY